MFLRTTVRVCYKPNGGRGSYCGFFAPGNGGIMDKTHQIQQLGRERIPKLLLKFSLPCVMGLLIGALYNLVDQIFIGNSELGYLGNAATGVSFPIICIANAFAWCIGDGAASYLSICSGRRDAELAHKCVGTGITVSAIIAVGVLVQVVQQIELSLILGQQLLLGFGLVQLVVLDQGLDLRIAGVDCIQQFLQVFLHLQLVT